jgi:hypothetical protein
MITRFEEEARVIGLVQGLIRLEVGNIFNVLKTVCIMGIDISPDGSYTLCCIVHI